MGRLLVFMVSLVVICLALAVSIVAFAPRQQEAVLQTQTPSEFSLAAQRSLPPELSSAAAHAVVAQVASMSLEQRIRSLLIVSLAGTDAAVLGNYVSSVGAGGFILMGKNIPSTPAELAAETAALRGDGPVPRLVAIDEEGGDVKRLPYDGFAGAKTLRNEAPQSTYEAFVGRSALLKSVGVTLNFGIVADVSSDPQAFIYGRSFGADGVSAAERVSKAVSGESVSGIASTLKHFPGHGSAAGDSHTSIPTSGLDPASWKNSDAVPFAAGIASGARAVMFGHLAFPAVDSTPASLSPTWHTILRRDFGFRGLAITDDMTMLQRSKQPELLDPVDNAIRAFQAGNDMLVYTWGDAPASAGIDVDQLVTGVVAAVHGGRISRQQIDQSALRAMATRASLGTRSLAESQVCNVACIFGYSRLGLLSAQG
jgi:beta-N-acetylhexosaminidase